MMGFDVTITQRDISMMIYVANEGRCFVNTKKSSKHAHLIKLSLFTNSQDFGNVKNMHNVYRLLFRILIGCLIPREGSSDHISWDHGHFI